MVYVLSLKNEIEEDDVADKTYTPGKFVWRELFSNDMEGSKKFYSGLFGWTINAMDMGAMTYTMANAGETPVCGMMPLETIEMEGVPPHWLSYVSVPNVEEAAAAVESGGGTVLLPPKEVGGMGKMCVLRDPQGAVISAWRANDGDGAEVEKPPVGTFCWDQLGTSDIDSATAFYEKVFAWSKGPFEGTDQMWVFMRGDKPAASLMQAPEGVPPHWLTYVVVEDLAASRAKVTELGGKVMMEEIPVPGIGKFAVIADNIGAHIALFEDASK